MIVELQFPELFTHIIPFDLQQPPHRGNVLSSTEKQT